MTRPKKADRERVARQNLRYKYSIARLIKKHAAALKPGNLGPCPCYYCVQDRDSRA